jgi:hypothetical protein
MNITEKINFIFFGYLLYQYNDKIISIIEEQFHIEITKNKNVEELLGSYHKLKKEKYNRSDLIILCLHNLLLNYIRYLKINTKK